MNTTTNLMAALESTLDEILTFRAQYPTDRLLIIREKACRKALDRAARGRR